MVFLELILQPALILDANEDCVLKSAVFYAQFPNSIKFEIRDSIGNIIDDTTLNVVPGKQRLTLNFEIPAGQSMRLGIGTTGSFLYIEIGQIHHIRMI